MHLFRIVLKERNNPSCQRDHYVLAKNVKTAMTKAKKKNPNGLYLPTFVSATQLSDPI